MIRVNRVLLLRALRIVKPAIGYAQHLQISYEQGSDHLEITNTGPAAGTLYRVTCAVPLEDRPEQPALWHFGIKSLMSWLRHQDTDYVSLAPGDKHLLVEDVSRSGWIKLPLAFDQRAPAVEIKTKHTLVFDQLGLIARLSVLLRVVAEDDSRSVMANVCLEYHESGLLVKATAADGFRLTQYRMHANAIGVVQATDGDAKHSILLHRDFVKALVNVGKTLHGSLVTLDITEDGLVRASFERAGVSAQLVAGLYEGSYPNVEVLTRKTTGSVRTVLFVRTDLLRIARQAAAIGAQAALLTSEDTFITLKSLGGEETVYASMGAKGASALPKIAVKPAFLVDALQSLEGKFARLSTNPEPGKPMRFSDDGDDRLHILMPMHMPDATK